MKRLAVCAAAMAAVIGVSVYSLFTVRESSRTITALVEAALDDSNAPERTLSLIGEADERWQAMRPKLDLFVRTDRLDEISCLISRLGAMYESGSDDFAAECLELEERLRLIFRDELPRAEMVL